MLTICHPMGNNLWTTNDVLPHLKLRPIDSDRNTSASTSSSWSSGKSSRGRRSTKPYVRCVFSTMTSCIASGRSHIFRIPVHFWQGWLFCVSFSFSTVATGVYLIRRDPALLERRMRFGPRAESRPRQKIIVAVIVARFAALLIVPGLDHRFGWSQGPAAIVALANLLIIAAFGFFLVVLRENTFPASTITVEAGQRVISPRPSPRLPHPIYPRPPSSLSPFPT